MAIPTLVLDQVGAFAADVSPEALNAAVRWLSTVGDGVHEQRGRLDLYRQLQPNVRDRLEQLRIAWLAPGCEFHANLDSDSTRIWMLTSSSGVGGGP